MLIKTQSPSVSLQLGGIQLLTEAMRLTRIVRQHSGSPHKTLNCQPGSPLQPGHINTSIHFNFSPQVPPRHTRSQGKHMSPISLSPHPGPRETLTHLCVRCAGWKSHESAWCGVAWCGVVWRGVAWRGRCRETGDHRTALVAPKQKDAQNRGGFL